MTYKPFAATSEKSLMYKQREHFALRVRAMVDAGLPIILDDVLEVLSRGSMRPDLVEQVAFARQAEARRRAVAQTIDLLDRKTRD